MAHKSSNKLSAPVVPAPKSEMDGWRVKEALDTIQRAEEHRRDKGLMKEVKKLAKTRVKALNEIC